MTALNDEQLLTAILESLVDSKKQLQISAERNRQLIESLGEGIALVNVESRFVFANPAAYELFDLSWEALKGRSLHDFCDEKNRTLLRTQIETGKRGEKSNFELEIIRAEDQRLTLLVTSSPQFEPGGKYSGALLIFRDCTQHIRMKNELRFLKKAFETIQLGVTITDLSRKIIFANPADAAMHGYSLEELYGKESRIFGLPEQRARLKEIDTRNFKTWQRETVNVKKDGTIFPVDLISDIVADQEGNPVAIITCCLDITRRKEVESQLQKSSETLEKEVKERTAELFQANKTLKQEIAERKKMEQALRESEVRYRNIVESSLNAIIIHSRDKINYVNPEAVKVLGGHAKEDFLGKSFLDIVHPEYHEIEQNRTEAVYRKKRSVRSTSEEFIRLDGKVIDVEVSGIYIEYKGEPAVLSTVVDVTEAKLSEENEKLHQLQLLQADKMISLGTLVSGVAHEINNPNNIIMLNSEIFTGIWESVIPILDRYEKTNKNFTVAGLSYHKARMRVGKLLEGLLDGSQRIKAIVKELKDFTRPVVLDAFQKVDINKMINSAVALTQNMIKRSTQRFDLHLAEDLPKVYGSFQRLEQVIINLIQNACQALSNHPGKTAGEIVISTGYHQDRHEVIISVKDDGEGIPEENLRFITDPFFTTKRNCGGTGLGLSVSLRIVQDHGGSLNFKSQMNQGTEVTVTLPAAPVNSGGTH